MKLLPERGLIGALIYIYAFFYLFKTLKTSIPRKIIFSFLLGILVMETATGLLDMTMYIPYLIILRQMFRLEKQNNEIGK
jgi:hypothetical protein